jgi:hypothetical protein
VAVTNAPAYYSIVQFTMEKGLCIACPGRWLLLIGYNLKDPTISFGLAIICHFQVDQEKEKLMMPPPKKNDTEQQKN